MEGKVSPEAVILAVASVFAIFNLINYVGTRRLIRWLYERYRVEAAALDNDSSIHEDFKKNARLSEERAVLEIISKRRGHRFDLSVIISNIEFILIASSTVLIMDSFNGALNYSTLSRVGIVILSWLGIKVLGYGGHWQQPIFGRSTFSVFLLGSIVNIVIGFGTGLILYGLFV